MCAHGPDVLPKSCHYLLLVMPMPGHPLTHNTLQTLSAEKNRENGEENMILKWNETDGCWEKAGPAGVQCSSDKSGELPTYLLPSCHSKPESHRKQKTHTWVKAVLHRTWLVTCAPWAPWEKTQTSLYPYSWYTKNQHFAQRLPTTQTTFTENEPTEAPSNNDHVVDMMTKQAPLWRQWLTHYRYHQRYSFASKVAHMQPSPHLFLQSAQLIHTNSQPQQLTSWWYIATKKIARR